MTHQRETSESANTCSELRERPETGSSGFTFPRKPLPKQMGYLRGNLADPGRMAVVDTTPAPILVAPLADRPGVHIKQSRSYLIVDADAVPALLAAIRRGCDCDE